MTSIYEVINDEEALKDIPLDNYQTVITQLKTLQRIAAISPETDALPVLYNENLHSAMQISTIPQAQFKTMLSKSGVDDNTIMGIHANAQMARVRNEQAILALSETYRGTGVAMIDNSLDKADSSNLDNHNLCWDMLFDAADFCECEECTSIYRTTSRPWRRNPFSTFCSISSCPPKMGIPSYATSLYILVQMRLNLQDSS
ncbi:hypothetical protein [Paenibacillus sp. P36]|uniref:hypothetical protein n=1 Tax=Paenibacillus sp. P36 TaxID=3342538 RepID=UPI0038B4027A